MVLNRVISGNDPTWCQFCKHVWHGLPCKSDPMCTCRSAFVDKYAQEEE